ncbi:hypothetical protein OROMI_034399 [Orobanche minor]
MDPLSGFRSPLESVKSLVSVRSFCGFSLKSCENTEWLKEFVWVLGDSGIIGYIRSVVVLPRVYWPKKLYLDVLAAKTNSILDVDCGTGTAEKIDNGKKSEVRSGSSKEFRPKGGNHLSRKGNPPEAQNKIKSRKTNFHHLKQEEKELHAEVQNKRKRATRHRVNPLWKAVEAQMSHTLSRPKNPSSIIQTQKEQSERMEKSASGEELYSKDEKQEEEDDAEKRSPEAEVNQDEESDSENTESDDVTSDINSYTTVCCWMIFGVCGFGEKLSDNAWLAAEGVYLPLSESKLN